MIVYVVKGLWKVCKAIPLIWKSVLAVLGVTPVDWIFMAVSDCIRVYLSLEENRGNAVFTFRNTSKDALNISEEELMERFTRGDASRNTEGNGLGLSIAKNLAELMDGELKILIDGDLFKALLTFPLCKEKHN